MFRTRAALLLGAVLALATMASLAPPTEASESSVPATLELSSPVTHGNLTIYFILGEDQRKGNVLTLADAMSARGVIVHETDNVNQLTIENLTDKEVFLQAGDIVQGGQQDRTIAIDLMLPPRSGKIPVSAFCVESGRWGGRGDESRALFSGSRHALNDNRLKLATRLTKKQGEVWKEVAQSQKMLARSLKAEVKDTRSSTSLLLSLESEQVQKGVVDTISKLEPTLGDGRRVIGYVVAINGQVNNADIFASSALFRRLWPKLLHASAIEAMANRREGEFVASTAAAAREFLSAGRTGAATTTRLALDQVEHCRDNKLCASFETRSRDGVLLRSSIVRK